MKKVDAIIVGQGLAGTCMAIALRQQGKSVCVLDPNLHLGNEFVNASRSAAGLFNPITGRKMVKTWMADELFAGLVSYYRQLAAEWEVSFLHEIPIYRPFLSVEDQNDWVGAEREDRYKHLVKKVYTSPIGISNYNDPYGGLLLKNSGYLDVSVFLDAAQKWLTSTDSFIETSFGSDSMELAADHVIYGTDSNKIKARWVIYCNGVAGAKDDVWSKMRFKPVKGEWLAIDIDFDPNYILNRGVFMIPREGAVRVGSTYDHQQLDHKTTEKGQKDILEKMGKIYTGEYRILDQRAGIRPATFDRKPFVGVHPDYPSIAMLNGLGAKGVTLAPYFANHLASHLLEKTPLLPEVDIQRCF